MYHNKHVLPLIFWYFHFNTGLGVSMVTISGTITVYYAVIIAYCTYYFFGSMQMEVPWKTCDQSWSTCYCRDGNQNNTSVDPWNGTRKECRKLSIESLIANIFLMWNNIKKVKNIKQNAMKCKFEDVHYS